MLWAIIIFIFILCFWAYAVFVLAGNNHHQFDTFSGKVFTSHPDDTTASANLIARKTHFLDKNKAPISIKNTLHNARSFADSISVDLETETTFFCVNFGCFDAEWAVAHNSDIRKRILFIHGGGFILGSAKGHRKMADSLAKIAGACVLSIHYRLMPEHSRLMGIKDSQRAYQWLLRHAPDVENRCSIPAEQTQQLIIAGDSAGGGSVLYAFQLECKQPSSNTRCSYCFFTNTG